MTGVQTCALPIWGGEGVWWCQSVGVDANEAGQHTSWRQRRSTAVTVSDCVRSSTWEKFNLDSHHMSHITHHPRFFFPQVNPMLLSYYSIDDWVWLLSLRLFLSDSHFINLGHVLLVLCRPTGWQRDNGAAHTGGHLTIDFAAAAVAVQDWLYTLHHLRAHMHCSTSLTITMATFPSNSTIYSYSTVCHTNLICNLSNYSMLTWGVFSS